MRPLRKTCQMMAVMGRKQGHGRAHEDDGSDEVVLWKGNNWLAP